jgi:sodium-independent sulfate anion transporter 11
MSATSYKPVYYDDSNLSYKVRAKEIFDNYASPRTVIDYFLSMIPIITWIKRYNLTWAAGDLIAGLTIGAIVVPQGMAYAKLATLPVEYGLYSSFTGVFVYCFFATSKDITIGPVAVMSLLIGTILTDPTIANHGFTGPQIAATISLLSGLIVLGIGIFRLGYLVDFISGPVIAGFMSGSALTIAISQVAGLLGIPNINTRAACYLVVGTTLGGLPHATADAAFGLLGLFVLYGIRYGTEFVTRRYPRYTRVMFFINTVRSVFLVIISSAIAYGIVKHNPHSVIKLNGTVPSGLQHVGTPIVNSKIAGLILSNLPVVSLILVLEHVAIAKSFGRLNDYVINPNQELIAIGVANILGSFFSSYPATGSFSRTAIKAKAGVRTPLAGILSGCVVILALYALTPAFYYIPNATLAAVIIHAVVDLFSGYKTWKRYWLVSPFEFLIFFSGVVIIFFTTVEIGVYVTVSLSLFILLTRLAHPRFSVLGRVPVKKDNEGTRYVYIPIEDSSVRSRVEPDPLPPGVVLVRLEDSYTYPNAAYLTDRIIDAGKSVTRRGAPPPSTNGERNWNDDGLGDLGKENLPLLRAMVIDFGPVSIFDSTALQGLSVARATLDRYSGRPVQWHFANVAKGSIRRALNAGGFGGETPRVIKTQELSMVPVLNHTQLADSEGIALDVLPQQANLSDGPLSVEQEAEVREAAVAFIHYDVDEAVRAASFAPL